jgi:hypothetical protein
VALPAIDSAPVQPVGPGLQPAPVPYSNVQPPLADREARPTLSFGVITPQVYTQGETFRRGDTLDETARAGLVHRLPTPGATFRLPVW